MALPGIKSTLRDKFVNHSTTTDKFEVYDTTEIPRGATKVEFDVDSGLQAKVEDTKRRIDAILSDIGLQPIEVRRRLRGIRDDLG